MPLPNKARSNTEEFRYVRRAKTAKTDENDPRRPIVFMHVPRSGGTSLRTILLALSQKGDGQFVNVQGTLYQQFLGQDKPETTTQLNAGIDSFMSASGHIPFGMPPFKTDHTNWISVVRNPAERLISHYIFGSHKGGWSVEDSIESLFESGKLIANPMTRQFAGDTDLTSPVDESTFERALTNSKKFMAICKTERLDDLVSVLLETYSQNDLLYQVSNQARSDISSTIRKKIKGFSDEVNQYDNVLLRQLESQPNFLNSVKHRSRSDHVDVLLRKSNGLIDVIPASTQDLNGVKKSLTRIAPNSIKVKFTGV
ncbi:MAG: sulfotransferase family 2 domain-containing protein [Rhodospirillaceae bacterium]